MSLYFFRRKWSKQVGTVNFRCGKCNADRTGGLFKRRSVVLLMFVIPIWYRKSYSVTCGRCFTSFKFDKGKGSRLEEQIKRQVVPPPYPASSPASIPTRAQSGVPSAQSPASDIKYCPHCGTGIARSMRFCPSCGRSLAIPKSTSESTPVQSGVSSAQSPRYLQSPVVKISNVAVSASLGEPIDLERVAKAFPGATRPSPISLDLRLTDIQTLVSGSGRIICPQADSEEQAQGAIEEVVRQLRLRKIPIHNEPAIQIDRMDPVPVFLGRGIAIHSLPEHVSDSLYVRTVGEKLDGRYNKAGEIIPLTSQEDIARRTSELWGEVRRGIQSMRVRLPHVAYCRIGSPFVVAQMVRGPDVDGNMQMTGYVTLHGAKSEAAAQEATRSLEKRLEEAGLLGPLTPRDKIPQDDLTSDPRAYDYYADDPAVWG